MANNNYSKFMKQTYPMFNKMFDWVQLELKNRKNNVYSGENGFSEIRTPFVRFTSGLTRLDQSHNLVGNSRFLTLGLHGYEEQANIFNLSYGNENIIGYSHGIDGSSKNPQIKVAATSPLVINNTVSNASANNIAEGTHPVPGVTRMTVSRYAMVPSKATVDWACYNLTQLEYLRHYFLSPGIFCVLDWGQFINNDSVIKTIPTMINFNNKNVDAEIANYINNGKADAYQNYLEPSNGNYDIFVGVVTNYNYTFDATNQRYNCTTQLGSLSEVFYNLSTDHTIYRTADKKTISQTTLHNYFNCENGGFMRKINNDVTDSNDGKQVIAANLNSLKLKALSDQTKPDNDKINSFPYTTQTYDNHIITRLSGDLTPKEAAITTKRLAGNEGSQATADLVSIASAREDNYITLLYFINVILMDYAKTSPDSNLATYINKLKFNYWNEPLASYSLGLIYNNTKTATSTRGLLSLDPAVFLLIDNQFPASAINHKKFKICPRTVITKDNESTAAQLSAGVWVNTKMIMSAMMESITLSDGLQKILDNISTATGNFWKLKLVPNDHLDIIQIVDEGYRSSVWSYDDLQKTAYKFNEGVKGELTSNMEFNASLPNQIASQVIFASLYQANITSSLSTFDFWSKVDRHNSIGIGEVATKYSSDITIGQDKFAAAAAKDMDITKSSLGMSSTDTPVVDTYFIQTYYSSNTGGTEIPDNMIGNVTYNAAQGTGQIRQFDQPSGDIVGMSAVGPISYDNDPIVKATSALDPTFRTQFDKLVINMQQLGYTMGVLETRRSQKRQQTAFNQGFSKTLNSKHLKGLAVDVSIDGASYPQSMTAPWMVLQREAAKVGLQTLGVINPSPGQFNDPGHVESPSSVSSQSITAAGQFAALPSEIASSMADISLSNDALQKKKNIQNSAIAANIAVEAALKGKVKDVETVRDNILSRFGNISLLYVDVSKDFMLNRIVAYTTQTQTIAENATNQAGFPAITPYSVGIETVGISGIIGGDVFLVDKLPSVYSTHGMFVSTEVTHMIDPAAGWKTKIQGRWQQTKPFDKE